MRRIRRIRRIRLCGRGQASNRCQLLNGGLKNGNLSRSGRRPRGTNFRASGGPKRRRWDTLAITHITKKYITMPSCSVGLKRQRGGQLSHFERKACSTAGAKTIASRRKAWLSKSSFSHGMWSPLAVFLLSAVSGPQIGLGVLHLRSQVGGHAQCEQGGKEV